MTKKNAHRKIVPGAQADAYAMEGYLIKSINSLQKKKNRLQIRHAIGYSAGYYQSGCYNYPEFEVVKLGAQIKILTNTLAHLRRNINNQKPF